VSLPQLARRLLVATLLGGAVAAPGAGAQTTLDGVIYTHFRMGLTQDSSYTPVARQNNFEVERAYLNVRSKSDNGITSRVTIDVDNRRAASNQLTYRLKYAFVTWTPEGSALTWKLGMQNTPYVGFAEDLWGYRFQGTVAIDRTRYVSSSDFGFAVEGAWKEQGVNMDVGVFNGETYSSAPGDNRKDLAGRVSVRLLETDDASKTGGLRLTGYAVLGTATGGAERTRMLGLLSYSTKAVRLGAEVAVTQDSTLANPETKGRVMSLFGAYQFADRPIGLMARVDRWDPDTDVTPTAFAAASSEQTRLIAGVSYQLSKNVRLLLDADVVSVADGPAPNAFQAANRSLFVHAEIKY
jgi:hypothetical protein